MEKKIIIKNVPCTMATIISNAISQLKTQIA
jgi:hypothetical protein